MISRNCRIVLAVPALCAATCLATAAVHADPALTLYNQGFGVVRETVPLDLKAGVNQVNVTNVTSMLEPDSVILRDPSGTHNLRVIEQNYRNDTVTKELLLSRYVGRTIDFLVTHPDGAVSTVQGKIIRGDYFAPQDPEEAQMVGYAGQSTQPIIEVDGKLRFSLPGEPIFPGLPDDTLMVPTLSWRLESDTPGPCNAEMAYITQGLNWHADYNLVAPEHGDTMDLIGWVTMQNLTGKTFEHAGIKLMAGTLNVAPGMRYAQRMAMRQQVVEGMADGQQVSEKAFDEYHLYTLNEPTTLRDRETKQVEFIRGHDIPSHELFVYDGAKLDQFQGYNEDMIRQQPAYGSQSNKQVWVVREFKNSAAGGLGIPLPQGRIRMYRRDTGGQLEFIGEDTIEHTPRDETVTVHTGSSFDLVGERRQVSYKIDPNNQNNADESFEIKLRNHKNAPVEIRVIEHLYRGANWTISAHSNAFLKTDSKTMEFRVTVPANEEKTVTYTVHYSW